MLMISPTTLPGDLVQAFAVIQVVERSRTGGSAAAATNALRARRDVAPAATFAVRSVVRPALDRRKQHRFHRCRTAPVASLPISKLRFSA